MVTQKLVSICQRLKLMSVKEKFSCQYFLTHAIYGQSALFWLGVQIELLFLPFIDLVLIRYILTKLSFSTVFKKHNTISYANYTEYHINQSTTDLLVNALSGSINKSQFFQELCQDLENLFEFLSTSQCFMVNKLAASEFEA